MNAETEVVNTDIIQHVKQFIQMYDFVTHVEEEYQHLMADPVTRASTENMVKGYALPSRQECIDHYASTHYVDKLEAERICNEAIRRNYLKHYQFGTTVDALEVDVGEGVDFIQKLGPFRIGMWADIQQRYIPYSVGISIIAIVLSFIAILLKR